MPATCEAGGQATTLAPGVAPAKASFSFILFKRQSRPKEGSEEDPKEGSEEERKLIMELAKDIFAKLSTEESSLEDASSLASLSRLGSSLSELKELPTRYGFAKLLKAALPLGSGCKVRGLTLASEKAKAVGLFLRPAGAAAGEGCLLVRWRLWHGACTGSALGTVATPYRKSLWPCMALRHRLSQGLRLALGRQLSDLSASPKSGPALRKLLAGGTFRCRHPPMRVAVLWLAPALSLPMAGQMLPRLHKLAQWVPSCL